MPKINVNTKGLKKALNVKTKVAKAKKAIKSAGKAIAELGKDVNSISIGLEKNKYIKSIEFNREGKDYTIKVRGK